MPFLRFKGFPKDFITSVSSIMIQEFSKLTGVLPEKVKIELLHIEQINNSPLSLEILMFPRDQELHDDIVQALYRILDEHGYGDVHIFFILLSPHLYYKEGQPLKTNPSEHISIT
ncbi:hypothetical protein GCM10008018_65110 [Paenibacillus marchantiophytorum]|uniref:DUF1904 family protein n=1 Tax=Paenibacillus marchantiophytorum TaxID=1619310 RepID=A0ABQ1FFV3_9BACL|nr:DUF1904 family protein [Paenibacillus marchantiophytorum]GGA10806.1 hypothetical protein GCM10008018_65110 [Paenibacillus marchantiophytorum]